MISTRPEEEAVIIRFDNNNAFSVNGFFTLLVKLINTPISCKKSYK